MRTLFARRRAPPPPRAAPVAGAAAAAVAAAAAAAAALALRAAVECPELLLKVIDNEADKRMPLLTAVVAPLRADVPEGATSAALGGRCELGLEANVFNGRNIHWEPLIEPWNVAATFEHAAAGVAAPATTAQRPLHARARRPQPRRGRGPQPPRRSMATTKRWRRRRRPPPPRPPPRRSARPATRIAVEGPLRVNLSAEMVSQPSPARRPAPCAARARRRAARAQAAPAADSSDERLGFDLAILEPATMARRRRPGRRCAESF